MPQRYTTKSGQVMVFPDDATPDEIQAAADEADGVSSKSLAGFGRNVVSSAGRLVSDTASAVAHPLDTLGGLGKTIVGTAQLAIPGEQEWEAYPKAIGNMYAERYGGTRNIADTLYNDPVGALADVATVVGGAGGALKAANIGAKSAKLGSIAAKAMAVADAINPERMVTAPLGAIGKLAGTGMAHISVRPGTGLARQTVGDKYRIAREVAANRLSTPERAQAHFDAAIKKAVDTSRQPMPNVDRASVVAFPKTLDMVSQPGMKGIDELADIEAQLTRDLPQSIPFADLFDYSKTWNREGKWNRASMPSGNPPVRGAAFKELADNARSELYKAPGLQEANKGVQTAMLAKAAVDDASVRPHALTRMLAIMGMGQPATATAMMLSDSPRVGANVGGLAYKAGSAIDAKALTRALILARMQQAAKDRE